MKRRAVAGTESGVSNWARQRTTSPGTAAGCRRPDRLSRLSALGGELGSESLLGLGDEPPVAVRVDERVRAARGHPAALVVEVEEAAMHAEKDVAWQRAPNGEAALKIAGDVRIAR